MQGLQIPLDVPDLWQQEAVRALLAGHDVIVDAPTGAGKTRIFELYVEGGAAARRGQAVYTVPTRALANDKWREWRQRGWKVGLATGDIVVDADAPVLVATLETQRERILSRRAPAVLVIDEYQMLADARRGLNYELVPALTLPGTTQLLLLSGSVRNPADVAEWLGRLGRSVQLVRERERPVPLEELPLENLPRVPDAISGFWPRLAAAVLLAGLAPLLVFAPRRAEAEKIARKIADALPPDDPIPLRPEDERLLGRELSALVARRVAYHHSGLSYAVRAGWIEPLAKNGHLRVVVATTGLAAGINFSVRTVLVAGTTYHDGPFQRELRPDELLQMFGRAGRRGLDTRGCVLAARNSPRLLDAAPRQLRRVNELDWPTLLRVMEEAAAHGEPPIDTASALGSRLFSRQHVDLGFDRAGATEEETPDRFGPTREEYLDSAEQWQPLGRTHASSARLAHSLARHREKWLPALRVPAIAERHGPGRLCRIPDAGGFHYGKEIAVATRGPDGSLRPLPWIRKRLALGAADVFDDATFLQAVAPLLDLGGATPLGLMERGSTTALQLELGAIAQSVVVDGRQQNLIDPPRRRTRLSSETSYGEFQPRPGTAAHAWRKLGLVDSTGTPTARGRVFNRFQAGEGLVIAAALEQPDYDVHELVRHLANLRAGHRFHDGTGSSDRLAAASRAAYGHVDYEGYLRTGLCEGYGEAAWETIERFLAEGNRSLADGDLRAGDVERAILEWRSLLRHITHAPDPAAPRWNELREAARACLQEHAGPAAPVDIEIPARFRQRATERPVRLAGRQFTTRIGVP
jgi:superfamily II DNA/RNA helicase